jgi:hypothetical protein
MNTRHLLAALLATATATTALANGGGYLTGIKSTGPFRPVNVDSVEMVSEKLDIELRKDTAVVNITYVLHNPGKAVKVEMGFPCSVAVQIPPVGDGDSRAAVLPQLQEFRLEADGKPVDSKLMKDHALLSQGETAAGHDGMFLSSVLTGWQVVKLPFAAQQTRLVKVSYLNPYYVSVRSVSDNSESSAPSMRYLFSAAALWSGPIRTGEVTVRATGVDPAMVNLSHPRRFKREGNQWTWTFTDFEPAMQDDLEILAGEYEFSQYQSVEGKAGITYIMRGRSSDYAELRKNGKWFSIGRNYTAKASSSLKSDGELTYGPENLYDDDSSDTWAEGAEGDGIGESVTLTMKNPQKAKRLVIHNGYQKSQPVFEANNRVKSLAVSLNGGAPFTVELKGGYRETNSIVVPSDTGPLKTVKLTIQSVYPGTGFRDTCISGVDVEMQLSKPPPILPCR